MLFKTHEIIHLISRVRRGRALPFNQKVTHLNLFNHKDYIYNPTAFYLDHLPIIATLMGYVSSRQATGT
jgi:hypothetical protein